jgi:hypothetical protein
MVVRSELGVLGSGTGAGIGNLETPRVAAGTVRYWTPAHETEQTRIAGSQRPSPGHPTALSA